MKKATDPKLSINDIPSIVSDLFKDDNNGRPDVKNHLTDFVLRPRALQAMYAQKLAEAWSVNPPKNVVQASIQSAECGTGKTLGYAVVAALYSAISGQRVAIYTNTLALQSQILRPGGDMATAISIAKKITGRTPRAARLIGRNNFASAKSAAALIALYQSKAANPEIIAKLQAIHDRIIEASDSQRTDYHWSDTLITPILADESLPPGLCKDDFQPSARENLDAYLQHQEEAQGADIVVMTHARLALDLLHVKASDLDAFKESFPFAGVVVDEADLLAQQARSIIRRDVSLFSVWLSVRDTPFEDRVKKMIVSIDKLLLSARTSGLLNEHEGGGGVVLNDEHNDPETCSQLIDHVDTLSKYLRSAAKQDSIAQSEKNALIHFADDLHDFINAENGSPKGITFSEVRSYPTLSVGYCETGWLFKKLFRVGGNIKHVFFTSATLRNFYPVKFDLNTIFRTFAQEVGIKHASSSDSSTDTIDNSRFRCEIDYETHCQHLEHDRFGALQMYTLLGGSRKLVVQDDPEHPQRWRMTEPHALVVMDVVAARHALGQRVLVVTQSKRDCARLGQELTKKQRFSNMHQDIILDAPGTDFNQQREAYIRNPQAVWISWRTGQGIDLPGLVNNLVVPRLPYGPPPNPMDVALLANWYSKNRPAFNKNSPLVLAQNRLFAQGEHRALKKFSQILGRGIRKSDDYCKAFVLDPRFPRPKRLEESMKPSIRRARGDAERFKSTPSRTGKLYLTAAPERFQRDYHRTGGAVILENQSFKAIEG